MQHAVAEPEKLVHNNRKIVGDNRLLRQTDDETRQSVGEIAQCGFALRNLAFDCLIPHNRTCNELREKRNVHQQIEKVMLHLHLFPMTVNHVGNDLEGEEADADGHYNVGNRD